MRGIAFYGEPFFKIKTGDDLIKESITRILITSPGERVMNPDFGCRLKSFIFAPELVLQQEVEEEIRKSINRWEPRVEITSIEAEMTTENESSVTLFLLNKETYTDFNFEVMIAL